MIERIEFDPAAVSAARRRLAGDTYDYDDEKCERWHAPLEKLQDVQRLADAYLTVTDDAPLTIEKLVELGGKVIPIIHQVVTGDKCVVFHKVRVTIYSNGHREWDEGDDWKEIHPPPENVGDLLYLLRRMARSDPKSGERSDERA